MTTTDRVVLPGRLGDPAMTLGDDPRADPRLVATLAGFGLTGHGEPPPVGPGHPLEVLRDFFAAAETGFRGLFAALYADLPPLEGVTTEHVTITGDAGNEIPLSIHRPTGASGPLPAIVHTHGGGMTILTAADPNYVRWRDELAATGLVVVGVEFRNAGGVLGPHPFPAGLDDCARAVRWVDEHRAELGVSKIVVSGESGGGNLALATALRANAEGWIGRIAGVYAQCPFIFGRWADPAPELVSLVENDDYFIGTSLMAPMAQVYDPAGAHADDPLAWPYHATAAHLAGLPPHVISVNQLDPLRDEGLAYFAKLLAAGVQAVGRTVNGTTHAADCLFRGALPDVYAATVRDIKGFADAV